MYILFDLEAMFNPDNKGHVKHDDFMEIIEIGAYKVESLPITHYEKDIVNIENKCVIKDEFHAFIKPTFHKLSKKMSKLTHITQEELENAKSYSDVIEDFIDWAGTDSVFVAWSQSDEQMINENNRKNYIYNFPRITYINLQQEYDKIRHKKFRTGLSTALDECDFTFTGAQHNALSDARNMLYIFQMLLTGNDRGQFKVPFLNSVWRICCV